MIEEQENEKVLTSHRHNYKQQGSYLICSCGKRVLKLFRSKKREGMLYGKKENGTRYYVRSDRRRYFFPDEWNTFISQIKNKEHKFFFLTCLHTGGRIMEVLNLRHKDFDVDRGTIKFSVVKQRKAKKNFYTLGKSRNFFVSGELIKEYKSFTRNIDVNKDSYIFLDNSKLPSNYEKLNNKEREKYYSSRKVGYSNMLKRKLKRIEIKDWFNFSPHNIRKTYGMWMRVYNIEPSELCYRMGHDLQTYMNHYGSSLIFNDEERRKIQKIMGNVK